MAAVGLVTVSLRRSVRGCIESIITQSPPRREVRRRSSATQHFGYQEGQLKRLLGVQPGVAGGLVPAGQVGLLDGLRTTEALGDVLPGELDVQTARVGAQMVVYLEIAEHLVDDPVEMAGLVAVGRLDRVAMHRVALPDHLVPGGGDLLQDRGKR